MRGDLATSANGPSARWALGHEHGIGRHARDVVRQQAGPPDREGRVLGGRGRPAVVTKTTAAPPGIPGARDDGAEPKRLGSHHTGARSVCDRGRVRPQPARHRARDIHEDRRLRRVRGDVRHRVSSSRAERCARTRSSRRSPSRPPKRALCRIRTSCSQGCCTRVGQGTGVRSGARGNGGRRYRRRRQDLLEAARATPVRARHRAPRRAADAATGTCAIASAWLPPCDARSHGEAVPALAQRGSSSTISAAAMRCALASCRSPQDQAGLAERLIRRQLQVPDGRAMPLRPGQRAPPGQEAAARLSSGRPGRRTMPSSSPARRARPQPVAGHLGRLEIDPPWSGR